MELYVDKHALKHGLSEREILSAWENFVRKQHRQTPKDDEIIAIGFDGSGRLIEMVAIEKPYGLLLYHAMTPPTKKFLNELELNGR